MFACVGARLPADSVIWAGLLGVVYLYKNPQLYSKDSEIAHCFSLILDVIKNLFALRIKYNIKRCNN